MQYNTIQCNTIQYILNILLLIVCICIFILGDSGFGMHTNKNREKSNEKGSNYNWLESVGLGTSFKPTHILKFMI